MSVALKHVTRLYGRETARREREIEFARVKPDAAWAEIRSSEVADTYSRTHQQVVHWGQQ